LDEWVFGFQERFQVIREFPPAEMEAARYPQGKGEPQQNGEGAGNGA
jgi:hypothetical protein